jgi:hypothetical protein
VKGQPIWVEDAESGKKSAPLVLHERSKGADGQTLDELVYVERVVISRRLMDAVLAERAKARDPARDVSN